MEGRTQETAAAMAGMSVRSARKWQRGPLPSETKQLRRWRTRPDPFEGVWEEEIEPLLRGDPAGKLKATTIIECPSTSSGGGASSRRVQRLPATHPVATITRLASVAWPGPRGPLPTGASSRQGSPDRLHLRQLAGSDHRRTAFPPHAVPADTQPLGMALLRGRALNDACQSLLDHCGLHSTSYLYPVAQPPYMCYESSGTLQDHHLPNKSQLHTSCANLP